MIEIWAFIGVNGSGKDFRANQKLQELPNAKLFDFSDGVRDFTFSFLGWWPENKEEYEEFKNKINTITFCKDTINYKGRNFLDNIGKRMRNFDPNFWAKYTEDMAHEAHSNGIKSFVFNSVRYEEEIQAIKNFIEYSNFRDDLNINFIFCDFHSEKYDDSPKGYQLLALKFRDMGCKDGQDITDFILNQWNN